MISTHRTKAGCTSGSSLGAAQHMLTLCHHQPWALARLGACCLCPVAAATWVPLGLSSALLPTEHQEQLLLLAGAALEWSHTFLNRLQKLMTCVVLSVLIAVSLNRLLSKSCPGEQRHSCPTNPLLTNLCLPTPAKKAFFFHHRYTGIVPSRNQKDKTFLPAQWLVQWVLNPHSAVAESCFM